MSIFDLKEELNWNVLEEAVKYEYEGRMIESPNHKMLVRSDTGIPLGIVSPKYMTVQPQVIKDFYKKLCDNHGFELEGYGSVYEGRHIWGMAKTPNNFRVFGQDLINVYVAFLTSYDKTLSTKLLPTTLRFSCTNMLSGAYLTDEFGDKIMVNIPHSSFFDPEAAYNIVMDIDSASARFEKDIELLATASISDEEAVKFFVALLYPNKSPKEIHESTRSRNLLSNVVNLYHNSPGQELRSAKGTMWGAVNTITYYFDHEYGRTQETRLGSALFGRGNAVKKNAMTLALETIAA